ncbi:MAG: insulinase family protein [Bryobacterales bacterium]|nr:insulinase family protein [Bryobacterales bacterium]
MKSAILFVMAASLAAAQTPAPAPAAKKAAPAAKPAATASKSYKSLKFPPMRELKLPDIATFTLPNGMKVFLLENHELPLVRGSARIRTGNIFETAQKAGLTSIFGDVMRTGGTKDKTGDQLNELLEGIAASVESDVGETSGTLSFNTLKENTDTVLAVFHDVLTAPEFRQDKIDVAKTQYRGVIARRNDQPGGIAGREFSRLLYGPTTPWGRMMEHETLNSVTRQDLLDWHKRYYFPENVLLAIQGDFNTAGMRSKLEKLFAGWTVKQPKVPEFPAVSHRQAPGVFLAEKNEVTQTNFRVGHLGGKVNDKDYPALSVMADILGANGFSSRMMKKIRSDLGLAYNVSANWNAEYDHPGTFTIGGSTKSESTVDALKAIYGEVERIRSSEVTDLELQEAKESTLNSFVFNFDSPSKTLGRLVTYEYHGYPKDFIFQYQKAIAAVSKADVLRVAKEYLKPENFVTVVVGKPADFGTPLSALNMPVNKIDLTIPEPKAATAKADAASLEKGRQLMAKLQAAVGGADKLAGVKDYTHVAQVKIAANGMQVQQTSKIVAPAARIEQQLPFGKIVIYSDGKGGGFMIGPQGQAMGLPPQAIKQAGEEMFRLYPSLWLSDRDAGRTVNAVNNDTVEITDKSGNFIRITLDAAGLPAKAGYRNADGSEVEAVYADFKDAGGIKFPHSIKVNQGGKTAAEVTVTEYKINSGLKPEDLGQK